MSAYEGNNPNAGPRRVCRKRKRDEDDCCPAPMDASKDTLDAQELTSGFSNLAYAQQPDMKWETDGEYMGNWTMNEGGNAASSGQQEEDQDMDESIMKEEGKPDRIEQRDYEYIRYEGRNSGYGIIRPGMKFEMPAHLEVMNGFVAAQVKEDKNDPCSKHVHEKVGYGAGQSTDEEGDDDDELDIYVW